MSRLRTMAPVLALVAIVAVAAVGQAAPITGTTSINTLSPLSASPATGVLDNPATQISVPNPNVVGPGTGDFATLVTQPLDQNPLTFNTSQTGWNGFTVSAANWGTFTANGTTILNPASDDNFFQLTVYGTFNPSGPFAGFDPAPAFTRFSVNRSEDPFGNVSYSAAITFAAGIVIPNQEVPEPTGLLLAGLAFGAAGLYRRYRRTRSA